MYSNVHHSTVYNTRTWKQPRSQSADEWIRMVWYIYTMEYSVQFSSSVVSIFYSSMNHSTPGLPVTSSRSSPKSVSIESVMPSNYLILCHSLLLLRSIFPSIRVFSNESTLCYRWPNYWSFSFHISPLMNTQDWSPLGWTGWISLHFKGLSRVFSNRQFRSINSSVLSFLYSSTLISIHDHWEYHSLD